MPDPVRLEDLPTLPAIPEPNASRLETGRVTLLKPVERGPPPTVARTNNGIDAPAHALPYRAKGDRPDRLETVQADELTRVQSLKCCDIANRPVADRWTRWTPRPRRGSPPTIHSV